MQVKKMPLLSFNSRLKDDTMAPGPNMFILYIELFVWFRVLKKQEVK